MIFYIFHLYNHWSLFCVNINHFIHIHSFSKISSPSWSWSFHPALSNGTTWAKNPGATDNDDRHTWYSTLMLWSSQCLTMLLLWSSRFLTMWWFSESLITISNCRNSDVNPSGGRVKEQRRRRFPGENKRHLVELSFALRSSLGCFWPAENLTSFELIFGNM